MKKIMYISVITIITLIAIQLSFPNLTKSKNEKLLQSRENTIPPLNAEKVSKPVMNNNINESDKKFELTKNDASTKKDILLVNKTNKLSQGYVPENLRIPNVKFISYADPNVKKMDSEAAEALEKLFDAALKDGIDLLAVSGYRPYSYQKNLYDNKVSAAGRTEADKYVAQPGASEHQTGLAMDVLSKEYSSLDEGFANTKAYKWLKDNCYKYGFIIRYPKEKQNITKYNFEPWHLRYVGLPASKEIKENNLSLEEYLNNKV